MNFKETEVLAKINQGDKDTFLKMYDFYAPKLFRHIYYRVGAKQIAEDIVQQVFLKIWRYLLAGVEPINNINAFLYKLTNNLVIDYYRRAERKNLPLDAYLEKESIVEPSYIKETEKNLEIDKIKETLKFLKPEFEEILIWRYLDGLTIEEIAKLCGKSRNAVYVCLHRALKELKKIIKNKDEIIKNN